MLDELQSAVRRRPVALVVDDAHQLDAHSASLILEVALTRLAPVVVSIRSGEGLPDAVAALLKDGIANEIVVRPMSRPQSDDMVEKALSAPISTSVGAYLFELAQGNPWFTRLLTEGAIESGALRESRGVWLLHDPRPVAPRLLQLIRERIPFHDPAVLSAVEALSLCEPLRLTVLVSVVDAEAVEAAERAGVIRVEHSTDGPVAVFGHPLYGEAVRGVATYGRLARLRQRLEQSLAPFGEAETLRRGILHLGTAGPFDPDLLTRAARQALAHYDLPLASTLAKHAVASGGSFDSTLLYALILSFGNKGEQAELMLEFALRDGAGGEAREQAIAMRVANLLFVCADPTRALAVLDAERDHLPGRSEVLESVGALIIAFAFPDATTDSVVPDDRPNENGSPAGDFFRAWSRLAVHGPRGDLNPADALVQRGYELSGGADMSVGRFGYVDMHLVGLRLSGHGRELSELLDRRSIEFAGRPEPLASYGSHVLGVGAAYLGRLNVAVRALREARAQLSAFEVSGILLRCLIVLSQVEGMRAERTAHQTFEAMRERAHRGHAWSDPEVEIAAAWVAAGLGDSARAVSSALCAAELAHERSASGYEALALQLASRFGDLNAPARLLSLTSRLKQPSGDRWGRYGRAILAEDAAALAAVAREEEIGGDLVAAADFAAQAAAMWRIQGRAGRAIVEAEHALRLAAHAGGARTPALLGVRVPALLSPRERQIVGLLAREDQSGDRRSARHISTDRRGSRVPAHGQTRHRAAGSGP